MAFGGNQNIIFAETCVLIDKKYLKFSKCMILMKLSVRNVAIFQITIEKSKEVRMELCPENIGENLRLVRIYFCFLTKKISTTKGLEPSIFRSEVGRLIH